MVYTIGSVAFVNHIETDLYTRIVLKYIHWLVNMYIEQWSVV